MNPHRRRPASAARRTDEVRVHTTQIKMPTLTPFEIWHKYPYLYETESKTYQVKNSVVHTYALPKMLVSAKRERNRVEDDCKLQAPPSRTAMAGWKIKRPKSFVAPVRTKRIQSREKPELNNYTEPACLQEFYNEPYLKYLSDIKGVNIKKNSQ